jgi:hypothetical protein
MRDVGGRSGGGESARQEHGHSCANFGLDCLLSINTIRVVYSIFKVYFRGNFQSLYGII